MSSIWAYLLCLTAALPSLSPEDFFQIRVVDDATGRGVPLVELETVNEQRYVSDSAGLIAIHEPTFFGQDVYFHIRSHGYEAAKDGFGFRGQRWKVQPGGKAEVRIKRINIAERLYRMTGAGIYRDSVLLGQKAPLDQPLLNAQVFGSDSVLNAVYRGRIYWFWGDTNRPSYPLGNYHTPGATSQLPKDGGLDPNVGVNLQYFVDKNGFAKETCRMPGDGPTWIDGLIVIPDGDRERLFAHYVKVKPPLEVYENGMSEFDDQSQQFVQRNTLKKDSTLMPGGHPIRQRDGNTDFVYFAKPYPFVRVVATAEKFLDPTQYEAWTYFKTGSRGSASEVERDESGQLILKWKLNTAVPTAELEQKLLKSGALHSTDPLLFGISDVETGKRIVAHNGSVAWNAHRQRWVMIFVQHYGTSLLGEVWYAEAKSLTGPWSKARKIVTHDNYSFYNPKHHSMFDQDGGRTIYFEGTYTDTFSGHKERLTPWYNYNQVMYRLDLDDPRLAAVREKD